MTISDYLLAVAGKVKEAEEAMNKDEVKRLLTILANFAREEAIKL